MSDTPITERQQYWLDHIRAADAFDGSIADYARSEDLKPKELYSWKGILDRRALLIPLRVTLIPFSIQGRRLYPSKGAQRHARLAMNIENRRSNSTVAACTSSSSLSSQRSRSTECVSHRRDACILRQVASMIRHSCPEQT
jgi:hypothetical protein